MAETSASDTTAGVTTASAGSTDSPTTSSPTSNTETTSPGSSSSSSGETTDGSTTDGSSSSGGEAFVLCDDADADLRACYDFADAGDGVLIDLSMYGNDGSVDGVDIERGPFGDAVRVGDDAEVSVPDSESLDVEGPATWEAWVYLDAVPAMGRVGILDNDGQYSMILYADMGLRCNGGNLTVFAPDVPVGQWVHLACTFDQDEMIVWVDGEPIDSVSGGSPLATEFGQPMSVGDTSPDFVAPLNGLVGGVRVWSAVRSQAEMTEAAAAAG